ncbi:hypothetical protein SSX86_031195 [Deinandra increscens subsp. villosa]|uniref:DUF4283 domain-containing protein n=1 Tax=Deinandra increscens subsp. villosa TaxID=3103831 RepID=A0AAP0C5W9_9ASTR
MDACKHLGRITDVYISYRKSRSGEVFGFIKFTGVKNIWDLEKRLCKVKIGRLVLNANVEKFDRGGRRTSYCPQIPKPLQNLPSGLSGAPCSAGGAAPVSSGRSFASVVGGMQEGGKMKIIDLGEMVTNAWCVWEGKALWGRAVDLRHLCNMHKLVELINVLDCHIRYMGGLQVLLTFPDSDAASLFLEYDQIWKDWFSKLERWSGQSPPPERIAWINIRGIPPHLWEAEVFESIGRLFGKIVQPSEADVYDCDISKSGVGILVNSGRRIQDSIVVVWKGKRFLCDVQEINEDWKPDFIKFLTGVRVTSRNGAEPADIPVTEEAVGEDQKSSASVPREETAPDGAAAGDAYEEDVVGPHSVHVMGQTIPTGVENFIGPMESSGPSDQCSRSARKRRMSRSPSINPPSTLSSPLASISSSHQDTSLNLNLPPKGKGAKLEAKKRRQGHDKSMGTLASGAGAAQREEMRGQDRPFNSQERRDIALADEVLDTLRINACVGLELGEFQSQVSKIIEDCGVNNQV